MKAITLFACIVLVYADPDKLPAVANWSPTIENTVVGVYQTVNLTCSFFGESSSSQVTWKKNGQDLSDSSRTGSRFLEDKIDMYLYIENTTLSDTAAYECNVIVTGGRRISDPQNLKVTETPALTMKPIDLLKDSDQVRLIWAVNQSIFTPEYYKIERATKNGTYFYPEKIDKNERNKTIEVPKDQTAYRFRIHAFAGNETHISPYSEWINTESEKHYKYVPKFEVTDTEENWIKITWKGPSQEHEREVDNYHIKKDNETFVQKTQKPGTNVTYQIINLTCGTNYTIDVAACSHLRSPDECGIWSGEKSVRTKECKNTASAASFQQKANGILVTIIGLCFLNKYHA